MDENKESEVESEPSGLTKVSKDYMETYPLRAMIKGIPYVGGSIDTLLAGEGAKWQRRRLESFIEEVSGRLEEVERDVPDIKPSEPLFDFVRQVFDEVVKSRSEEKRKRFANIVREQVVREEVWEDAETATRILGELEDKHVEILNVAVNAPECSEPFEGMRAVRVVDEEDKNRDKPPLDLREKFSDMDRRAIQLYCSELISRGLLHDEGIGRYDTKAFQYFIPTDLADWFIDWVEDYN